MKKMSINRRRILREYYDRDVTELNSLLELIEIGEMKLTDRWDDESEYADWNTVEEKLKGLRASIERSKEWYPWILRAKV